MSRSSFGTDRPLNFFNVASRGIAEFEDFSRARCGAPFGLSVYSFWTDCEIDPNSGRTAV
jgi:hypothetical protein